MGKNIIQGGSIVDLYIEELLPPNEIAGRACVAYIKKDVGDKAPEGLDELSDKISALLIGHSEDDVLDFEIAKLNITKVYANINEYNNREVVSNIPESVLEDTIRLNSIVSVIHNEIKRDYIILEPNTKFENNDGLYHLQECYTNSPLGINLLGKKVGDKVAFDVSGVYNSVEVTEINNSLVYANTNDDMESKKIR